MNRPTGVTVLAVLQFIGAGFCVLAGLLMMVGGTFVAAILSRATAGGGGQGSTALAGMGAAIGVAAGVFFLIVAALYAALGWGMWGLKNWARVVTMVLAGLGGLLQLMGLLGSLLHFHVFALLWNVIWIGVNLMIIWYLLQPQVKAAFEGPQPQMRAAGM